MNEQDIKLAGDRDKVEAIESKDKVFIVSPTNSGSTVLRTLLSTAEDVSALPYEGRLLADRYMKDTGEKIYPKETEWDNFRVFSEKWREIADPENYEWGKVKKLWAGKWIKRPDHDPEVLVEKSPSNVFRTHLLKRVFRNPSFIYLYRHPLPLVEGIMRRGEVGIDRAIRHVRRCFEQMTKSKSRKHKAVSMTYARMTDRPGETFYKLRQSTALPDFGEVDLSIQPRVHNIGEGHSDIMNFNPEQVENLTDQQKAKIEEELDKFCTHSLTVK